MIVESVRESILYAWFAPVAFVVPGPPSTRINWPTWKPSAMKLPPSFRVIVPAPETGSAP